MDHTALRELTLFMENDGDVHRRLTRDFLPNLDKKVKSGKYDRNKAPALFLYLVDFGAEKYARDFGSAPKNDATAVKREARRMFPTDLRKKLAESLRDDYEDEAANRGVNMETVPTFKVGDRVVDKSGVFHDGVVEKVGDYDAHLGDRRYYVREDRGGKPKWRNGKGMKLHPNN